MRRFEAFESTKDARARSCGCHRAQPRGIHQRCQPQAQAKVNPSPDPVKDNTLLNALLTAEYDAIATYSAGAALIALDSGTAQATRDVVTSVAVHFQDQHKQQPVTDSMTNVLKFAAGAERGASVAYNQVLAGMEDAQLRFLASSIEGDESQHFIVLAALVLGLASPGPSLSQATAVKVFPEAFVSSTDPSGQPPNPADLPIRNRRP
ncbi:MAG TPA: hypothetical protein VJV79_13680 [Polyangiaceae bacterium]|nr:hypothetical protein [Polyangiaceae bacterium]